MSKLLAQLLVVFVFLIFPPRADTSSVSTPGTLTIFLKGDSEAVEFTRLELARIIRPAHLNAEWKRMSERQVGVDYARLVAVELHGACLAKPIFGPGLSADTQALASTAIADGRVLPFSTVDCDNVRKLMSAAFAQSSREMWPELFGRALARVIAHELFHMLAQTRSHKALGISKACFNVRDLTADRFDFDEVTLAQIRPPEVAAAVRPPQYEYADDSGR